jgi:hypothetical protein
MGERIHERGGHFAIKVGGCGMDMGFSLVYGLSRTLYREGHACTIGEDHGHHSGTDYCPSNDHVNDRNWSRYEGLHSDGGYAVSQRWL